MMFCYEVNYIIDDESREASRDSKDYIYNIIDSPQDDRSRMLAVDSP